MNIHNHLKISFFQSDYNKLFCYEGLCRCAMLICLPVCVSEAYWICFDNVGNKEKRTGGWNDRLEVAEQGM